NKPLLKEIDLKKIIFDGNTDIDERYFDYDNFQFALLSMNIDDSNSEIHRISRKNIVEYLKYYDDIEVMDIEGFIGILFCGFKERRVKNTLGELVNRIDEDGSKGVFITVGKQVSCIKKIGQSYRQAKTLVDKKFLYLENRMIWDKDTKEHKSNIILDIKNHINKIYSYVEVSDLDRLREAMIDFRKYVVEREYSEKQIKIIAIEIFIELKSKLIKDYNLSEGDFLNNEEIIQEIYSRVSLTSTINYLVDKFENIAKELAVESPENSVKRIINYMEKNYYKDLKLEALAHIFNYNSAYLGKLLKNAIGENFNTHLDRIRIEKAKALLVNDKLKVYQVCEKVGYKNIDYFHSKFKKYVGTSPRNYKKENEKINTLVEIVDMAVSDNC
ncbi:helix-turn-helix domain-containing protein, partial [Clostridium sp. HBUAS56017]